MYKSKEERNAYDRARYHATKTPEKLAALAAKRRKWRAANPDKVAKHKKYTREQQAAYMRKYRADDPERARAARKKAYNPEYHAAYWQRVKDSKRARRQETNATWRAENRNRVAWHSAQRRAAVRRATPAWLTPDDHWLIGEIYDLCALRTQLTGVEHHVDHIYPLKGRNGCGLHVPTNLRVIPGSENRAKRNREPVCTSSVSAP